MMTFSPIYIRFSDIADDSIAKERSQRQARKRTRRLGDIVIYAESILKRIENETLETFVADADVRDAVYYRFLCISEAARTLLVIDPAVIERSPEVPWARVRNIGNVLRHEFGEIDSSAIWQIINGERLRDLLSVARKELLRSKDN